MRPTIWFRAILISFAMCAAVAAQTTPLPFGDGAGGGPDPSGPSDASGYGTGPYSSAPAITPLPPRGSPQGATPLGPLPRTAPPIGPAGIGGQAGIGGSVGIGGPAEVLPGQTATAENGGVTSQPIVVDVIVRGNKKAALSKVYSYLRTRKGREFDPQLVQGDVRRLTQSGLFRDVRTFTDNVPGGVIVRFEVLERPTVGYIRFLGNRGVRDKTLLKEADMKVGESLNQYSVEEGRRKIQDYYQSHGYPKTEVSILEGNKPTDSGVVYVINEGQLERISSVEFVGNTIASGDRLKTQIESKAGYLWYFFAGKVDRDKIDADVEKLTAYYRSLGYFRARIGREIELDDSGRWAKLRFVIDEGPRYVVRNVSLVGNQKFATDTLQADLNLKPGEYFNQAKMNRDVAKLKDTYGGEGHIFADVQADPRFLEEPGELDLVYRIQEGDVFRVGKIDVKIDGEFPHTRQSVVMNRISLRPGDILDVRELRRSEQRLKASQLFEIDPSKGAPPELVVVPPDLLGAGGSVADRPKSRAGSRSYRGQSPE
jgi:outer membrane protein insertion porin family